MAKVRAGDRTKTGLRGTKGSSGKKFPVATKAQAKSAIKLRGKGKGVSKSAVLSHVASSKFGNDPEIKAKIAKARKADRGKKK